jgi:hypothetical protein
VYVNWHTLDGQTSARARVHPQKELLPMIRNLLKSLGETLERALSRYLAAFGGLLSVTGPVEPWAKEMLRALNADGGNFAVRFGQHTTVAAADTVAITGLASVAGIVVQLDDDPVDGVMHVTATIGDQAGTPAAGSVIIKGWKSTDADATLIAATTFAKKVNYLAWGTPSSPVQ